MTTGNGQLIAARAVLGPGIVCFTTAREFDPVKGPWREGAERLADLLEEETGRRPRAVVVAGQVHGNQVVWAGGDGIQRIEDCDGLATREPGVFLAIRTADCVPVVIADAQARLVGACHAGWRGTRCNITGALVDILHAAGGRPEAMRGWIGPAICQDHYEVSPEMAQDFLETFGHLGEFLDERMLDLIELNRLQAVQAGMRYDQTTPSGRCTYAETAAFHSHRRGEQHRGQQYTVCGLTE